MWGGVGRENSVGAYQFLHQNSDLKGLCAGSLSAQEGIGVKYCSPRLQKAHRSRSQDPRGLVSSSSCFLSHQNST